MVQYSILPTWIVVALLFLFSCSEYCSLHHLSLSFLFLTFPFLHGNAASNIISLVFFVVNLPWHDWWSEVIWWGQCTAMVFLKETRCSPLFMVSLTLFCGISWKLNYLSCMVHHTNFSLVWGSLRLASLAVVQS